MREAKAVEAVWRERAQRLSQRPVSAGSAQDAFPVLVLGVAKERFGIDLPDVAEVLPALCPTPVPGAAAVFAGVINVHGEIRPVINLKRCLGMQSAGDSPQRVILLRQDGRELGLQIDSVEHIRWLRTGEFRTGEFRIGEFRAGEFGAGEFRAGEFDTWELDGIGNGSLVGSPYIRGSTKDLLMLLSTQALFRELPIGVTN
jgi:chemotaxis signal transduction protein